MLMVDRKKYFITIREIYFSQHEQQQNEGDIIRYIQSTSFIPGCTDFYTLHIDLLKDQETLFAELDSNTRYEVRRAINKDSLKSCINKSPEGQYIDEFSKFYNKFAQTKGIPLCNKEKLYKLKQKNALIISEIRNREEEVLCYHVYICDSNRARLLYSASHFRDSQDSLFRALVGRSNRLLHWMDIVALKDGKFKICDLGGISMSEDDDALINIDRFKKGFGGTIVKEYNYTVGRNLVGKAVLKLYDMRNKPDNNGDSK